MKVRHFSFLFVVLVTVCLTAGTSLGKDTTGFEPFSHRSALGVPTLTVMTAGTTVTASWSTIAGATGYTLSYALYPYTGPDSIVSVEMGSQTSISAGLSKGAAFYVAVQAYDSAGSSGYSNIKYFIKP